MTVAGTQTPGLHLGSEVLNNNFKEVDEFKQMTAGVATLFVRSGEDFVRVSTSLTKQDGSRAIGTLLDHAHPAYAKLMAGQSYVGRALLFDRSYMTQYTPVRDGSGKVIAVLFVGFDYTDAQNAQFDNLKRFRIGQTGSLALLDEQNKWLVAAGGCAGAGSSDSGDQWPGENAGQRSVLGRQVRRFLQRCRAFRRRAVVGGGEHAESRDSRSDLERRYATGDWQSAGDVAGGWLGGLAAAQQTGAAE